MSIKNYLIIGGSSGIGKALTSSLSHKNHQLFATYNQHLIDNNDNVASFKHDVLTDDLDVDRLPESLDGLVYCPGSINLGPFGRLKPEDFRTDFELQVVGAIKTIQKVLPKLKKALSPSIISIFNCGRSNRL